MPGKWLDLLQRETITVTGRQSEEWQWGPSGRSGCPRAVGDKPEPVSCSIRCGWSLPPDIHMMAYTHTHNLSPAMAASARSHCGRRLIKVSQYLHLDQVLPQRRRHWGRPPKWGALGERRPPNPVLWTPWFSKLPAHHIHFGSFEKTNTQLHRSYPDSSKSRYLKVHPRTL